jgi:hypothetical protein
MSESILLEEKKVHHLTVLTSVPEEDLKKHVSYSELVIWVGCNFRHKLKYIDKISLDKPSEHTIFGHTIHDVLQEFLKTRHLGDIEETIKKFQEKLTENNITVKPEEFHDTIKPILEEVPSFLDENFKDWTFISSEEQLFETIGETGLNKERSFKGFVDGIIKVPKSSRLKTGKPDEYEYHLIDWKTTGWGWDFKKKTDPNKIMQLALYKHFVSQKLGIDLKDIKCSFVLLKRLPKKDGKRCELVSVSVGPKTLEHAMTTLKTMLSYVKKGLYPKNKNNCTYCEYKNTTHCP